jgi:hypothetical protein
MLVSAYMVLEQLWGVTPIFLASTLSQLQFRGAGQDDLAALLPGPSMDLANAPCNDCKQ